MPLIPKETKFFDMTTEQTRVIGEAVNLMKKMIKDDDISFESVRRIKELEQNCDTISHEIIHALNETFITPIDREDIYKLVNEIDDIMDLLNVVANRLYIFRIKSAKDTYLNEFIETIDEAVTMVGNVLVGLKEMKKKTRILDYCIEINRLENSGDSLREKAIMNLFEKETDPINIIKWKELYEVSETILDACEKVAKTVEEVMVKNG
ncbi:MAG: DUF47 family protein [Elusimicrobiales bacterium]|jgi:predicted phosphate transport protein (TIGR00153 family)|nr:DUF47 family protein [Elusimicrobiales bacterium]NLH40131.1 DUF47 family protein [Elusimicrobiota bacterium]